MFSYHLARCVALNSALECEQKMLCNELPKYKLKGRFILTRSTEHGARSTQHAARSTQHAARSTEHAARSTQHGARSTEHGARSTQHAARINFNSYFHAQIMRAHDQIW